MLLKCNDQRGADTEALIVGILIGMAFSVCTAGIDLALTHSTFAPERQAKDYGVCLRQLQESESSLAFQANKSDVYLSLYRSSQNELRKRDGLIKDLVRAQPLSSCGPACVTGVIPVIRR